MVGSASTETAFPDLSGDAIAWVTTGQMAEVDRIMVDELGIALIQMMEHAGRSLARLAVARWDPEAVCVVAGTGGNGGGGLVAARHLANWGVQVAVVTSRPPDRYAGVPGRQLEIVSRLGIPVLETPPTAADLLVDAVIGYGLQGAPGGRSADLIGEITARPEPVLSLDTPSGLDTTTGEAPGDAVAADATLTLAAPKVGLRSALGVGELYLADISVPPSVFESIGATPAPRFRSGPIARLRR